MTDDRIELRGLRVTARCGVLPEERTRDQPLEIDLDLIGDLKVPGRTDDLADTADYGAVVELVAQVCVQGSPKLLEHLAESIADALLASDAVAVPAVHTVQVAVRKLRPPVPQHLATSGVRITRSLDPRGGE